MKFINLFGYLETITHSKHNLAGLLNKLRRILLSLKIKSLTMITRTIVLIGLILITIPYVEGFEFNVNAQVNFGWSVKTFFEDVHEAIVFDPVEKARIEAEHAENAQQEIIRLTDEAQPIPIELVERVNEKLVNAKQSQQQALITPSGDSIQDKIKDATDEVVSVVKQVSEANEIRLLVGEYTVLGDKVKNKEISNDEARIISQQLDIRTNNLEIVKKNCWSRISTYELALQENPYQGLQEICPELKKYNFEEAQKLIDLLPK